MKKLPKRNGYKPKPRERNPPAGEVIREAVAAIIVGAAKDWGVEVPEEIAKLAERKGQAKVTTWF